MYPRNHKEKTGSLYLSKRYQGELFSQWTLYFFRKKIETNLEIFCFLQFWKKVIPLSKNMLISI